MSAKGPWSLREREDGTVVFLSGRLYGRFPNAAAAKRFLKGPSATAIARATVAAKRSPRRVRWSASGGPAYVELKRINDIDGNISEVQLVRAGREQTDLPRWWTFDELRRAGITSAGGSR